LAITLALVSLLGKKDGAFGKVGRVLCVTFAKSAAGLGALVKYKFDN